MRKTGYKQVKPQVGGDTCDCDNNILLVHVMILVSGICGGNGCQHTRGRARSKHRSVYSHELASYWSYVEYIPRSLDPIGPMWSIFPGAWILLVLCEVYSQELASYWSRVEYIPRSLDPIGPMWSIFPGACILLVPCGVYSQELASYWSYVEYIPMSLHPIGPMWMMFP
jgi:tetrahydromethanopterin S-methyltransferase subunit B